MPQKVKHACNCCRLVEHQTANNALLAMSYNAYLDGRARMLWVITVLQDCANGLELW